MGRAGGRQRMIAFVIVLVIGILLIGLVFKLLKVAIVVALCVGAVLLLQKKLSAKRIK
jgi:hypothetical protein